MCEITLQDLKRKGQLLGEVDFEEQNSDIYAGTNHWYWYDNRLFVYTYHANNNSYTGRSGIDFLGNKETLSRDLKRYRYIDIPAFSGGGFTDEIVKKICELCGVEYDENNYF